MEGSKSQSLFASVCAGIIAFDDMTYMPYNVFYIQMLPEWRMCMKKLREHKLENGARNPSINLLKRIADGMDMVLKIEFLPKQNV